MLTSSDRLKPTYFISLSFGTQMSGIKDEDFVSSNYSPLVNVTAGKWYFDNLGFQVGLKGFYFYTIADDEKHHYNYVYGEAILNVNNTLNPERKNRDWDLNIHAGPGFFYNHFYDKPNFCANLGMQNNYKVADKFKASFDIAAIIGWDIYQGNTDILPGMSLGLIYQF
ncbi:hypothetical protein FBQ84_08995 [Ignavibacteria bacterium CHB1]|nr:hypothetical protein [Ignavibacteria bacterium]MDL1887957.1 hypothetical protein [Ignavibacteria bacterium CHB1]